MEKKIFIKRVSQIKIPKLVVDRNNRERHSKDTFSYHRKHHERTAFFFTDTYFAVGGRDACMHAKAMNQS